MAGDVIGSYANFNSIKVRLERETKSGNDALCQFQFHKGTIRTHTPEGTTEHIQVFQFHKGTIRTQFYTLPVFGGVSFQFHKGTIRTQISNLVSLLCCISIP